MSRLLFWGIIVLTLLSGLALLGYLLLLTPPIDSTGSLNVPAIILFFTGLGLTAAGFSSSVAAVLHDQWPGLAGVKRGRPDRLIALRQGLLIAAAVLALAALALAQQLDIAFVIVTLLMVGLVEAFIQSRA
ncbi:MAG: hypothetical protein H6642_06295 [Caldilineaceae bacterium]|nr:hypothetical protein [Caldilineaceae bacterium]